MCSRLQLQPKQPTLAHRRSATPTPTLPPCQVVALLNEAHTSANSTLTPPITNP